MFFSRKEKLLDDRKAELVFNWRGSRGYQLGKLFALVFSVIIFGLAVYALKIEVVKPSVTSIRKGVVTMVDEGDFRNQGFINLVETLSPFPPRWDPAYDVDVFQRIDEKLTDLMEGDSSYSAELLPMPEERLWGKGVSSQSFLSAIGEKGVFYDHFLDSEAFNGNSVAHAQKAPEQGELTLNVSLFAGDRFSQRLAGFEDGQLLPKDAVSEDAYGQSYRFIIGVDERGRVISSLPAMGRAVDSVNQGDSQRGLMEWLRGQVFQPVDEEGIVVETVELRISATRRKGE